MFGTKNSVLFGVAPAAMQRVVHPDGELATARACRQHGVIMGLTSFATTTLEEVGEACSDVPNVLQLYLFEDREHSNRMIQRAKAAGYKSVVLTVDTPLLGTRNLEIRNQFRLPGHIEIANFADTPEDALTSSAASFDGGHRNLPTGPVAFYIQRPNPTLDWEEAIPWLKQQAAPMEVWVKGIFTAEDAVLAIEHDVDGIILSNHGGRQLDRALATLDALPEIVAAVDHRIPVHVDGGIRHGSDIFKALAWGADFRWIGRPVLWGLAYNGQAGVKLCLGFMKEEFRLCMGPMGVTKVTDISRDSLCKAERNGFLSRL